MILLDFSAIVFAALHVDIKGGQKPQYDYIRHLILNTIRAYNAKFRTEYGEMLIISDNKSWRQSAFPLYKYARNWEREKNPNQDWDSIWGMFSSITEEIKQNLPYPFLSVQWAEADDIIGVISKLATSKTVIVSNDKDFGELVNDVVKQYRPITSGYFKPDDITRFKYELIMKGDKADGVPNIRSWDDFYMAQCIQKDGGWDIERAKPVSKKLLEEYWEVYQNGTEAELENALGQEMYENFKRNRRLISLTHIPELLVNSIKDEFEQVQRNEPMKLLKYFQKHKMHILAKHLGDFTPNRSELTKNKLF